MKASFGCSISVHFVDALDVANQIVLATAFSKMLVIYEDFAYDYRVCFNAAETIFLSG